MNWLKRHSRLYVTGGLLVAIAGSLSTIQGIWGLISNEPLIPFIIKNIPSETTFDKNLILTIAGFVLLVLGILFTIFVFKINSSKAQIEIDDAQTNISKEDNLTEILINMHKRMIYLTQKQFDNRITKKQLDDSAPLILDKLELVRLDKYKDFKVKVGKRLRRVIPKSPKKRKGVFWNFKVISKADEIKRELIDSKKWQVDDMVKVGNCLDDLGMGIGNVRNNDTEWQNMLDKVQVYMKDNKLNQLIYTHISCSYAICTAMLEQVYSKKTCRKDYEKIAHSVLVDSGLTPERIALELNNIIIEINNRLQEIDLMEKGNKFVNMENIKVNVNAKDTDKATGMNIDNVPTKLSGVEIDVNADNVKEATGLKVTSENTRFALSSKVIICSCGYVIRSVTTCGYEPVLICPRCGSEHKE